jgi:hypothetical protein
MRLLLPGVLGSAAVVEMAGGHAARRVGYLWLCRRPVSHCRCVFCRQSYHTCRTFRSMLG